MRKPDQYVLAGLEIPKELALLQSYQPSSSVNTKNDSQQCGCRFACPIYLKRRTFEMGLQSAVFLLTIKDIPHFSQQ
jgi:hypothetical protein